jgi:hypothetical protein
VSTVPEHHERLVGARPPDPGRWNTADTPLQ